MTPAHTGIDRDAVDLALTLVARVRRWYEMYDAVPVNVAIIGDAMAQAATDLCEHIANLGRKP